MPSVVRHPLRSGVTVPFTSRKCSRGLVAVAGGGSPAAPRKVVAPGAQDGLRRLLECGRVCDLCSPRSEFLVSPSFLWMNLMEAVMKFVSRSHCFLRDRLCWNQWLLKQAWPQSRLQGMVSGTLSRHSGGICRCGCGSLIASCYRCPLLLHIQNVDIALSR